MLQVQVSHEQVVSKLSLAEMQLVELQAKRLEGLQVPSLPSLTLNSRIKSHSHFYVMYTMTIRSHAVIA